MTPPDIGELMAKAQEMQGKLTELHRELARRRFEGSAGGGMVTAVATGELRVVELNIEPSLIQGMDREMIQDLCAAAVNSALANAQRGAQEEMQRLSGSLGIPNLDALGVGGQ